MRRKRSLIIISLLAGIALLIYGFVMTFSSMSSPSARGMLSVGERYLTEERYDEAVELFSKAIQVEPNSAKAYVDRGTAYEVLGDTDLAAADYQKAIEIDPEQSDIVQPRLDAIMEAKKKTAMEDMWKSYAGIARKYLDVYNNKLKETKRDNSGYNTNDNLNGEYYLSCPFSTTLAQFWNYPTFTIYDVNSDGVPELFISLAEKENANANIYDVYTYSDGQTYELMTGIGYRAGSCIFCESGIIKNSSSGGYQTSEWLYQKLPANGKQLEIVDAVSIKDGVYYHSQFDLTSSDKIISEEEFDQIMDSYPEIVVGHYASNDANIEKLENGELSSNEVIK